MFSQLDTIIRKSTKKEDINIICPLAHERFEENLTKIPNTNFYVLQGEGIRRWNVNYAKIPDNYYILDGNLRDRQIPSWLNADLVICHNIAHLNMCMSISQQLHIPLINIFHILPSPGFDIDSFLRSNHDVFNCIQNVFITEYNRSQWGFDEDKNALVIEHGIDENFWSPDNNIQKEQRCITVCNDFINRDVFCGYTPWKEAIQSQGVPHKIIGTTPELSLPCNSTTELRGEYIKSMVYVNTSLISPIPMALLEGLSCGLPAVCLSTCAIPEIIKHGYNGYLVEPHDIKGLNHYTLKLLNNEDLCNEMGYNARKTIVDTFSLGKFLYNYQNLFNRLLNRG